MLVEPMDKVYIYRDKDRFSLTGVTPNGMVSDAVLDGWSCGGSTPPTPNPNFFVFSLV